MKFAHSFMEELQSNAYPTEWKNSAIRYRQLKKCIKKVQNELAELGLSVEMLKLLAAEKSNGVTPEPPPYVARGKPEEMKAGQEEQKIGRRRRGSNESHCSLSSGANTDADSDESELSDGQDDAVAQKMEKDNFDVEDDEPEAPPPQGVTFSYWFDGTLQSFIPKLVLTVSSEEGIPMDLNLAPETRKALEDLVRRQQQARGGVPTEAAHVEELQQEEDQDANYHASEESSDSDDGHKRHGSNVRRSTAPRKLRTPRTIQIPLSADAEFFRLLTDEISSLEVLQTQEEQCISSKVVLLGDRVTDVARPKSFTSHHSDLYAWREIFRIYTESGIFFSQRERDGRAQRSVEKAEEKMRWFREEVERLRLTKGFKNKQSTLLFQEFMGLNMLILRLLKFQSINKTAMRKILKKFDKRTALGAREIYPSFIASDNFVSSELAKAICFTMNERLVSIIPQLDDYLCPICSSISIKPVRLSCSHVFCVRCLVKLQRERKRFCPICRSDVVLDADSDNLDLSLWRFLKEYFPKESKIKQMENEREVTLEQFRSLQSQHLISGRPGACHIM
ncbi:SPX domain-containing protein [Peziza echinospora]|nr:SPX domain-containing protein [Peziza echinospora]